MTARTFLSALTFPLALAIAQPPAPTPAPAPAPTAQEMPADAKAYQAASRISDSDKKIAAFEKFKLDFPQSNYSSVVDNAILSTLLRSKPDEKDRIHKMADAIYKAATAKDKEASRGATIVTTRNRETAAQLLADQFLISDKYLKDAETWAKRSIDPMRRPVWISEQRESFEKRKQKIPPQEELEKRFEEMRAARVGTLGRIEWKLGREALGKKLMEESYAVTSTNIVVAGALGEAAMKAGEDAKALDYFIPVRLSGHAPQATNTAFETLYKKSHNGSLDGLEAVLDTEYRKRFPNPVHAETYKAGDKRSERVVLGEVFTGSGCPPCAAADLAFDAAMERFTRKDLAVVMYHQHIPRPDPMTTIETTARAKFYAVRGVPTFAVDGKDTIGGGSREMTQGLFDRLLKDLDKAMETPAEAHIRLGASLTGNGVRATAAVDPVKSEFKELRVQILLVEKELRFNGENGIRFHPMVVRAFGGEKGEGYPLEAAGGTFAASFDLDVVSKAIKDHLDDYESKGHRGETFKFAEKKYAIDRGDLAVVAFVQDTKTKHVLQAAWMDLAVPGAHPTTEVNANPAQ